uniref:Long-distance movement protein n=1 Tax=Ethiopian tobacco bushy top virus TaxID=1538549 RepID=A0A7H1JG58_9TOMB|nr:long-distance movement protein [Ethiopian tobacco bushy top virus]
MVGHLLLCTVTGLPIRLAADNGRRVSMTCNINVFTSSESSNARRTPRGPVWRGHHQGASRNRSGRVDASQRRPKGGVYPPASPKDTKQNGRGVAQVPPYPKHRGAVIRREGGGGVHPPRTGRCARGSGSMDPRQPPAKPKQYRAEAKISAERRAEIDGLLSPLFDTLGRQVQGDAAVLRYCFGATQRQLRKWRKPVQPAHNVAAPDRKCSAQLPSAGTTNTEDLQGDGKGRSGQPDEPEVVHSGGDVPKVHTDCGRTATNKW